MFNLVSSNFGSKRDDYGVGDLLAEVSKRSSSISAEDRQEIAEMSKRLRQHTSTHRGGGGGGGSNNHTPIQTPDNSQHDKKVTNRNYFGKDLLKVDNLLRGFGGPSSSSPPPKSSSATATPVSPPCSPDTSRASQHPNAILLRGFGQPHSEDDDDSTDDVADSCGYGHEHNL